MPRMAVYCIDTEANEGNKMDYCDYIAHKVHAVLKNAIGKSIYVTDVEKPKLDLHPTEGWLQSTNKTIKVVDRNGRKYKVTVEAVEE